MVVLTASPHGSAIAATASASDHAKRSARRGAGRLLDRAAETVTIASIGPDGTHAVMYARPSERSTRATSRIA